MHIKILLLFAIIGGLFIGSSLYARPPIFFENYKEALKVSHDLDQQLVIVFSADWCGYCVKLKKAISNNLDKFEDTTICIVDVDKHPDIAAKYKVSKIPDTIFLDKNGKQLDRKAGYFDPQTLER